MIFHFYYLKGKRVTLSTCPLLEEAMRISSHSFSHFLVFHPFFQLHMRPVTLIGHHSYLLIWESDQEWSVLAIAGVMLKNQSYFMRNKKKPSPAGRKLKQGFFFCITTVSSNYQLSTFFNSTIQKSSHTCLNLLILTVFPEAVKNNLKWIGNWGTERRSSTTKVTWDICRVAEQALEGHT